MAGIADQRGDADRFGCEVRVVAGLDDLVLEGVTRLAAGGRGERGADAGERHADRTDGAVSSCAAGRVGQGREGRTTARMVFSLATISVIASLTVTSAVSKPAFWAQSVVPSTAGVTLAMG